MSGLSVSQILKRWSGGRPPPEGVGDRPVRVLVVEDNPADVALLRSFLRADQHFVVLESVPDLDAARIRLEAESYDAMLLELGLPGCVGTEALTRALPHAAGLPVLVLSGTRDPELAEQIIRYGAQDFILKSEMNRQTLRRSIIHAIERSEVMRALARAEEQNRSLIWNAQYGIFRATDRGVITQANPACASMLGFAGPEEVIGQEASFLQASRLLAQSPEPEEGGRPIQYWNGENRTTAGDERSGEVEIQLPTTGETVRLRLHARRVEDPVSGLPEWEGFLEDVTEAERAVREERQTAKMTALGQFSAGVAHDLNNLFTVMLGTLDAAAVEGQELDPELQEDMRILGDAVEQGAHLVQKILGFSRKERLVVEATDLTRLVLDSAGLLRRMCQSESKLTVAADPEITAPMDVGAFRQILTNLVKNADQASTDGAEVEVSLTRGARATRGKQGNVEYAILTVRDHGCGISEENLENIFEPFFSTRERTTGTGLGLAMVHGLVEQMGGAIDVDSTVGAGTEFRVYFPLAEEAVEARSEAEDPSREPKRLALILVVEDEPDIRRIAIRALKSRGYDVVVAQNGREGLAVFHEHETEIGLIISDVVMPELTGGEMYNRLRAEGYNVPVLFTSGYTSADLAHGELLDPSLPLLPKPWSVKDLLNEVDRRLPMLPAAD